MLILKLAFHLLLFITVIMYINADSMIKKINDIIYVGGNNKLSAHHLRNHNELDRFSVQYYTWPNHIMNGSDIGFKYNQQDWPANFDRNPSSMAFDTCLNWKQEHSIESNRDTAFDYQHRQYHTPSGNYAVMGVTCTNNYIKSVESFDKDTLWVCGTFGAFPRAFLVNKNSLKFIKFVDVNIMSCARYIDEPMVTYRDVDNNLYVASGWGLYRPDKNNPDIPDNNSTMLYADWRLYRNLFTLPSAMAWVLSSDVNFINVVKETKDHLYFFGHEINNQYGLNNQEDRHAWQSFMLRICKADQGFKYVPVEIASLLKQMTGPKYQKGNFGGKEYTLSPNHEEASYNKKWYQETAHLPTKHFVTALKINFGCFMGKRPRAISDNHYWGETNVIYFNKLGDVIFNPNRTINFKTKNNNDNFGCTDEMHSLIPLVGVFNHPGLQGTVMTPAGALCQLQINSNIFNEIGSSKPPYHKTNALEVKNAYEEMMALNSASYSNFYSRTLHRTNGFTLYPYWNQGVLIGDNKNRPYYKNAFDNIGKCENKSFYENMHVKKFLEIQNFSNTAWPNELPNKLSSIPSSICQFSAAELYSFNATFVLTDVEFKKIFLLRDNITDYVMNPIRGESVRKANLKRHTSPLMVVAIVATTGQLYRVVLCDFDNAMRNRGEDHTSGQWYNWCIFRHTDQPYLYRQYSPMERREWGESYQYRASSLLEEKIITNKADAADFPMYLDPQFHVVKDVLREGDFLHVLTENRLFSVNIQMDCKTHKRCIDCASDPDCMWHKTKYVCTKYNETEYKDSEFVQDVLDRGFKCASVDMRDRVKYVEESTNVVLNCPNAAFWRGQVVWRLNDKHIDFDLHQDMTLDSDRCALIISDYSIDKYDNKFSCHGVKDDHDKLHAGTDYEWAYRYQMDKPMILHTFTIVSSGNLSKMFASNWLYIVLFVAMFVAYLLYTNRYKLRSYFCAPSNAEIPVVPSTSQAQVHLISPNKEAETANV